jgi:hypothetical protein
VGMPVKALSLRRRENWGTICSTKGQSGKWAWTRELNPCKSMTPNTQTGIVRSRKLHVLFSNLNRTVERRIPGDKCSMQVVKVSFGELFGLKDRGKEDWTTVHRALEISIS